MESARRMDHIANRIIGAIYAIYTLAYVFIYAVIMMAVIATYAIIWNKSKGCRSTTWFHLKNWLKKSETDLNIWRSGTKLLKVAEKKKTLSK
jgi:hypothetical protein